MKTHNAMTTNLSFKVEKKAPILKKSLSLAWVERWFINPIKRWKDAVELRRKITELDDHLLRDVGLHETDYAAECKMRRKQRIMYPMF